MVVMQSMKQLSLLPMWQSGRPVEDARTPPMGPSAALPCTGNSTPVHAPASGAGKSVRTGEPGSDK
jgi:hypothetical protein